MTGDTLVEEPVNEIPLETSVKQAPLDQQPVNKIPLEESAMDVPPNQVSAADNVGNLGDGEVRTALQDEAESLLGKHGREVDSIQNERYDRVIDDDAKVEKPAALDTSNSKNGKENYEPIHEEDPTLPQKPIKRARTGYFIFADEKRAEIQAKVCGNLNFMYLPCHHGLKVLC